MRHVSDAFHVALGHFLDEDDNVFDPGPKTKVNPELEEGIEELALMIVQGTADLVWPGTDLPSISILDLLKGAVSRDERTSAYERLTKKVEGWIGWDVIHSQETAEGRIWDLLDIVARSQPGRRTGAFLRRVSNCYLYGLDAECMVMCRSVLDAELEAEISNDECIDVLGQRTPPYFGLADRIAVALKQERITYEGAQDARDVKDAGNMAVHGSPEVVVKGMTASHVIEKTIRVIEELNAGRAG